MNPNDEFSLTQKRGRAYLLTFTIITLGFDILAKAISSIAGTLHGSDIIGTFITIVLLFFLWRGSRVAWWIMLCCVLLALTYSLALFFSSPLWLSSGMFMLCSVLLCLLLLPATREHLAYRRQ